MSGKTPTPTVTVVGLALATALALGRPVRADEWDVGVHTDNGNATRNALFHGAEQVHDLAPIAAGVPDQDWILLTSHPFSSYQVIVDGMTGDLDLESSDVQHITQASSQNARVSEFGHRLTHEWQVEGLSAPVTSLLRIQGAACGTQCTAQDRYRVRAYDTTYTIPRFNNTGSQTTVLLVQNASDRDCTGLYLFFDGGGSLLGFDFFAIRVGEAQVHPTAPDGDGLSGKSGSVRVIHTCGYGGLSGKAVSLEPATGFAFDTLIVPRPQ